MDRGFRIAVADRDAGNAGVVGGVDVGGGIADHEGSIAAMRHLGERARDMARGGLAHLEAVAASHGTEIAAHLQLIKQFPGKTNGLVCTDGKRHIFRPERLKRVYHARIG